MIECNTRTSVMEKEKVNLETPLLTDRQLDGCICPGFGIFDPGHKLPRRYCFTLVQR